MAVPRRPYTAMVVAHTHWDREWYATFERFRIRLVRLIDKTLDLLERDSRFRYFTLDGQTIVLEDYLEIHPGQESRLRALVQSGRLIVGPWYVLPDEFLVSGEALIRNLMLGARVGRRFGPVMAVGYVPDPFGHIAQLPQILAGFGIDSFIFSRGLGEEGETLGSEFMWCAPDGTHVLAIHQIGWDDRNTGYLNASSLGYANPWVPRTGEPDLGLAVKQLSDLCAALRRYARTPFLLLNNGCDHLEPQPELPAMLELANAVQSDVMLEQGTFVQYVEAVRKSGVALPAWRGELRGARYSPLLSGVFSTRMYLKQENARTEMLLERWAEPFSALAWLEDAEYPTAFLWQAWRYLLSNHPHDSICGCSVDEVHAEMQQRYAKVRQLGEHFTGEALAYLAARSDVSRLPAGAAGVVVFNPLGWLRTDPVRLTLDLPPEWAEAIGFEMVSPDGARTPCQILARYRHQPLQGGTGDVERVTLGFFAEGVPPLGYRLYGLRPMVGETPDAPPDESPEIENPYYRVMARDDGAFDIIYKPTGHTLACALTLEDAADAGDEYTFAAVERDAPLSSRQGKAIVAVKRGPVLSTVEIVFDWALPKGLDATRARRSPHLAPYPVCVEITLWAGSERLEVRVAVDNTVADHRLRLLVPTGIEADSVAVAGQYAVLERSLAPKDGEGWAERPGAANHNGGFVGVGNGRHGVALIAGALPEYEAKRGPDGITLALTLLRCVGWLSRDDIPSRPGHAGPGLPVPGAQCPGPHNFELALYLHEDGWREGGAYRQAAMQDAPLRALMLSPQDESLPRTAALPADCSFLNLEGESLVLSAVKRSEDGCWLVVRAYNVGADQVAARLRCYRPVAEAVLLRLDESLVSTLLPDADGTLPFVAPGHGIVTLGLRLGRSD